MKKLIIWLAINSAIGYVLYLALIENSERAGNLLKFLIVVLFILTTIALLSKIARAQADKNGPSVPLWVNWIYGLAFAGMLAYYGWFFYASLDLVTTLFQTAIFHKDKESL